MEEDIKILEEFINFLNKNGDYVVDENLRDEKIALEHLVQAYKQQADIIKNSVSKYKLTKLKDFIINDCKQNNIDLIPLSNLIKNINILLKGDEQMTEEEKAVEYVNSILEYKKLYGSMGNIEDFLRGIDKEQIKIVLNLIQKQQEESEEKDKIIDEMVEMISKMETGIKTIIYQEQEKYCEFMRSSEERCWKTDKACKDCIKQYFKKKVEENL